MRVRLTVFLISAPRASGAGVVAPETQPLREDRGKVEKKEARRIHRARIGKLRPPPPGVGKQLKQQGERRAEFSGAGRFI
jgi:hypothetical protein